MPASLDIPCKPLEKVHIPPIPLPFGGELRALADTSRGIPTDCALIHSLMLQLMPTLAGMTCLVKMLKVVALLPEVIKDPLKVTEIETAIADMSGCMGLLNPIAMVKAILLLIISFVKCFLQAVQSLVNFQASIDLNAAQGNPVLLASLKCAQDNAQTALEQQVSALDTLQTLLLLVEPFAQLIGIDLPKLDPSSLSFSTPSTQNVPGSEQVSQGVEQMEEFVNALQQLADTLPG